MMTTVAKLYEIEDLKKLEEFLTSQKDIDELREILFLEFLKYADYKNVDDWNKSVRLSESLAIIGWGKYEPLEALRGMFFNGNPWTFFVNKFGDVRFVDAKWSKRTTGYTLEQGRTSYHSSPDQIDKKKTDIRDYEVKIDIQDLKIGSQRNWTPKNPIWFMRIMGNCYANSKAVLESIKNDLQIELNKRMRPEKYGRAINIIEIDHDHSFYDNANCKQNYIISESDKKLTSQKWWEELHKLYSEDEIKQNGYYLRSRFKYGPFRSDTGKMNVNIHFEKAFSELSHQEQKDKFSEYALAAVNAVVVKLKKKRLDYNFDLMLEDFTVILNEWKNHSALETIISDRIQMTTNLNDNNENS